MILVLVITTALAAEPCPGLAGPTASAPGDLVPGGVVVGGRLACDGLLLATEDARAPLVEAQDLRLQLVDLQAQLVEVRAERDSEREARRQAELRAAVAEARVATPAQAPASRPMPTWAAMLIGGGVTAAGTSLGVAACHAVGAP